MIADRAHCAILLAVMPGDGIARSAATLAVLAAADRTFALNLAFEEMPVGVAALRQHGSTLPDETVARAKSADGIIMGPIGHHDYPPGALNPSAEMRKRLELFANIRPARSRAACPPRCGKPVDLVIVRENTEGFYADYPCMSASAS